MSFGQPCPAPAQLLRLLKGTLPEDQHAALMEHLETCGGCREALEALAASRQSWEGVAQHLRGENEPDWAQPVSAVRKATLDFLDPPAQPGHLGRLAHYEVLEVIGRGGMGIVLKALDTTLQRIVAVKVMAPELAVSATARQRSSARPMPRPRSITIMSSPFTRSLRPRACPTWSCNSFPASRRRIGSTAKGPWS